MSLSGPAGSKPVPPSPFSASCGTASPSPSVSPAPHKIHRARKTMNRPPPGQVRSSPGSGAAARPGPARPDKALESKAEGKGKGSCPAVSITCVPVVVHR